MNTTESDLFPADVGQLDSPRLAWMKRHGVITLRHQSEKWLIEATWFAGFQAWHPELGGVDFFAVETGANGDSRIGEGDTEEEALGALARRAGIRLWNEEDEVCAQCAHAEVSRSQCGCPEAGPCQMDAADE